LLEKKHFICLKLCTIPIDFSIFIYFIVYLDDNRVDLITCFVTLHHVPHLDLILSEFVRILRPGGYLIIREHDCKNSHTITAKYLNFVHAFMMIARVGEFAGEPVNHHSQDQGESGANSNSDAIDWKQQKSDIIKYTNSIQYRTRDEWHSELKCVGFRLRATLDYDQLNNPQELYYAIYQLNIK
jgi:SAM-dependent methyltransferase